MRRVSALLWSAAIACGGDPVAPDLTFNGTYVLSSINAKKVPASETVNGVPVTVKSGTLVLNEDLTYVVDVDAEATLFGMKGDYPVNTVGVYTRSGETVGFTITIGDTQYDVVGVHASNTMTLTIAEPTSPIHSMVLIKRRG